MGKTSFALLFFVLRVANAEPRNVLELIGQAEKSGHDTRFLSPQDGSTFPSNWPVPTFSWEQFVSDAPAFTPAEAASLTWTLRISESNQVLFETSTQNTQWTPDPAQWGEWKGKTLRVELAGVEGETFHGAVPMTISVDASPLADDVVFRYFDFTSGPAPIPHIVWMDPVTLEKQELLIMNRGGCIGCHSTRTDSPVFCGIYRNKVDDPATQVPIRRLFTFTPGGEDLKVSKPLPNVTYPRFSPRHGKIICMTAFPEMRTYGWTRHGAAVMPFDLRYMDPACDIMVYDPATDVSSPLPGASGAEHVEILPVWSHDEEFVAFVRYEPTGRMDVYRVSYNEGKGGPAVPIEGASGNGFDNYFPEFSPDGRWIAFTRADASGGFLARSSSDIYIAPAKGGRARRLQCNAEDAMDSWHSWSSDSRWLLYASKRDSIDTRLYVTRIDEKGNASTPLEIPTELGYGKRVNMPAWSQKGKPGRPPLKEADLGRF